MVIRIFHIQLVLLGSAGTPCPRAMLSGRALSPDNAAR